MALLEINGLKAYYGQTQALYGLDFSLEEGSITTILGANGAGKTTTLRSICRMIHTEGDIRFLDEDLTSLSTEKVVRRGIAHVPEGRGTFVRQSVEDNLQLGAYTRTNKKDIADDIERVYSYFPRLRERYKQQAGTLSGGEQQRVAIARALSNSPRLLLADEPTGNLDPENASGVLELLAQFHKQGGTILLVPHDDRAAAYADRSLALDQGRLVESGAVETTT